MVMVFHFEDLERSLSSALEYLFGSLEGQSVLQGVPQLLGCGNHGLVHAHPVASALLGRGREGLVDLRAFLLGD